MNKELLFRGKSLECFTCTCTFSSIGGNFMKLTRSNTALTRLAATLAVPLGLGTLLIGGSMKANAAPPGRLSFDMVVSAWGEKFFPKPPGHLTFNKLGGHPTVHVL